MKIVAMVAAIASFIALTILLGEAVFFRVATEISSLVTPSRVDHHCFANQKLGEHQENRTKDEQSAGSVQRSLSPSGTRPRIQGGGIARRSRGTHCGGRNQTIGRRRTCRCDSPTGCCRKGRGFTSWRITATGEGPTQSNGNALMRGTMCGGRREPQGGVPAKFSQKSMRPSAARIPSGHFRPSSISASIAGVPTPFAAPSEICR